MAVALDAVSSSDVAVSSATSFSDSTKMTVGASANALVAVLAFGLSSVPTGLSVTWNGVAMTQVPNTQTINTANVVIFAMLSPAAGTNAFAASWTSSHDCCAALASFTGVDTSSFSSAFSNGNTATSIGNSASISVLSQTTSMAVMVAAGDTLSFSSFSGGTAIFNDNAPPTMTACAMYGAGASPSVTLSATSANGTDHQAVAGVSINAPGVTVTAEPRAPHVTKLPGHSFLPVPQQAYNQALYAVTVAALPFNQTDFTHGNVLPDWQGAPPPPLNINLFTNPFPFNQTDWSKADTIPRAPFDLSVQLNQNLLNLFPFNQVDWLKPVTVPRAPRSVDQALNINLFTNPIPFLNLSGASDGWGFVNPLAPQPAYNAALYTVVVQAAPFNQSDWAIASRPRPPPPTFDALNINLFTNPYPVSNPTGSAAPWDIVGLVAPPQPYSAALYTVIVTTLPFNQTDWAIGARQRPQPQPPDPLNLNLFTNPLPFAQLDWARPLRLRPVPMLPDTLNLNLFGAVSGTVLFDAVSSSTVAGSAGTTLAWTHTPVASPPSNVGVLLQNYTNSSITVSGVTYGSQALTQNAAATGGVIGISPAQTEIWGSDGLTLPSGPQTVTITFSATGAFCIAGAVTVTGGNTTTCFSTANAASATSTAPSVTLSGTSVGEFTVDIAGNGSSDGTLVQGGSQTLRFGPSAAGGDDAAGSSLPSAASTTTMSWTTTSSDLWTISAASFKAGTVFVASLPFNQSYWTAGRLPRPSLFAEPPLNLNLLTGPVPAPFIPLDWSRPFAPRAAPSIDTPLNLNLFTNPFPILNLAGSSRNIPGFAAPAQPYNVNLYGIVVVTVLPFNQNYWPAVTRPAVVLPLPAPLNLNLFTNPIPFAQLDWSKPFPFPHPQPLPPLPMNLSLTAPIVVSTVLHARPFFVTMGLRPL